MAPSATEWCEALTAHSGRPPPALHSTACSARHCLLCSTRPASPAWPPRYRLRLIEGERGSASDAWSDPLGGGRQPRLCSCPTPPAFERCLSPSLLPHMTLLFHPSLCGSVPSLDCPLPGCRPPPGPTCCGPMAPDWVAPATPTPAVSPSALAFLPPSPTELVRGPPQPRVPPPCRHLPRAPNVAGPRCLPSPPPLPGGGRPQAPQSSPPPSWGT